MGDPVQALKRPAITGNPAPATRPPGPSREGQSFGELLRQTMDSQTQAVTFSRHAEQRARQREIPLTEEHLRRLDQAVESAGEKGLNDTLVLMGSTAFIVNVPSRVVVTVMEGNESDHTVVTNIDGAVFCK